MALAALGKRQSNRTSPVKSASGIFPRRPSGSRPRANTKEVPLFVPDEEDDIISQAAYGSDGDEWEDFDELEEAQMSIAIAESLESQHRPRGILNTRALVQPPILKGPVEPPKQTGMDDSRKGLADGENEFTSPSRLATQLSIAGARKPLSTRISLDSIRRTAAFSIDIPSVSPEKSTQSLTPNPVLGDPCSLTKGDTSDEGESDDDDMEEVTIPQVTGDNHLIPSKPPVDPATAADIVGTPLAIGVEDVVAKRFAEFQKVFAKKRNALRAENLRVPEEMQQTREVSRPYSPGLEYADDEDGVIEDEERGEETIRMRSSPPPHSDGDEDMEEVEVIIAPPSVPPRSPQPSANYEPYKPSAPTVTESLHPEHDKERADVEDEDAPISDWSRSPSPRPRPPAGVLGSSTSVLTLDRSRGLLDPDESFEQVPPGERDQEHEDFDAAHEMDPDAEVGEFARWMSQVKGRNLDDVRKEIEQEINVLRKEQKAAMRDSEDITGQMIAQIMVSSVLQYHLCISF